jgi:hypothetical protein
LGDVWKRRHFGWEYKGSAGDLKKAFKQLQLYRPALEYPPDHFRHAKLSPSIPPSPGWCRRCMSCPLEDPSATRRSGDTDAQVTT